MSDAKTPDGSFCAIPAMQVEVIEAEIRRIGRRIAPPEQLWFVAENGRCEPLAMYFLAPDCASYREAIILDIGLGSFALATTARLELDDEADLIARHAETGRTFFEEHVLIKNERPHPHVHQGKRMRVFGMETLAQTQSPLYKCILDSIFLSHLAPAPTSSSFQLPFD